MATAEQDEQDRATVAAETAATAAAEAAAAAHLADEAADQMAEMTEQAEQGEQRAPHAASPLGVAEETVHGQGRGVATRLDTTAIEERLRHVTPGSWRRHGCDIWADDEPSLPLFMTPRERDSSAERRAQADRDADFIAHAAEDIRALLGELRAHPGGHDQLL